MAQNADMTVNTIADSPKTTIVIDSDGDQPTIPMKLILASPGLQIAADFTRIFTKEQTPTSMERISFDDEHLAH